MEGVDYAFPPLPDAAGLAAAGKRFAGRYVGPGSGKFLTPPERDALHGNGIDIFLLVEGATNDAAGGRPVGQQHAQLALADARALGAPDTVALYFAVDYQVATADWTGPQQYLAGAGDILGPGRVGVYGEYDVMAWAQRDGVAAWFFQTYAWSGGQWFAGNHVEQYLNTQTVAGGLVDLCRSKQANFGQWAASPAEGKMIIVIPGPTPGTYYKSDGTLYQQITDKDLADLRYIASLGAIQLWKDPSTGSDIWNGGITPAFGVDIATLTSAAAPTHTHPVPATTTGPAA